LIESWEPSEYIGVDIIDGPCVDVICNADELIEKFGSESFDIVLSIEMLEHSRNWKRSIHNIKHVSKSGGYILLTTRSYGYPCHGFPNDFWRFEYDDMKDIFSDCNIEAIESDYQAPGIFIIVKKPLEFIEKDLSDMEIYTLVSNKKATEIGERDYKSNYYYRLAFKQYINNTYNKLILESGKTLTKNLRI